MNDIDHLLNDIDPQLASAARATNIYPSDKVRVFIKDPTEIGEMEAAFECLSCGDCVCKMKGYWECLGCGYVMTVHESLLVAEDTIHRIEYLVGKTFTTENKESLWDKIASLWRRPKRLAASKT